VLNTFARNQINVCVAETWTSEFAQRDGKVKLTQMLAGNEIRQVRGREKKVVTAELHLVSEVTQLMLIKCELIMLRDR